MKTVILSGSPRQDSITHRVALFLHQQIPDSVIVDVRDHALPMVNTVWGKAELVPALYKNLYDTMYSADAFVFVTPEYNGGYSPALKNLLDHFPKDTFARKSVGIVTASTGSFGGMRAAQQMQQMICAFFAVPCPHMMVVPQVDRKFAANGELTDESYLPSVERFLKEWNWLSNALYSAGKL